MRERLFDPGAFAAFCEGFTAELELRRREHIEGLAWTRRELATVEREIRKIIDAIKVGVSPLSMKDELEALERRRVELSLATADAPLVVPGLVIRRYSIR